LRPSAGLALGKHAPRPFRPVIHTSFSLARVPGQHVSPSQSALSVRVTSGDNQGDTFPPEWLGPHCRNHGHVPSGGQDAGSCRHLQSVPRNSSPEPALDRRCRSGRCAAGSRVLGFAAAAPVRGLAQVPGARQGSRALLHLGPGVLPEMRRHRMRTSPRHPPAGPFAPAPHAARADPVSQPRSRFSPEITPGATARRRGGAHELSR
jgi:hypothetical protein